MRASTVEATGSVKKQVTCESCGHQYQYEMTRTAPGTYSGFALTSQEANGKAALDAARNLKEMLATHCDVIPCPQCGAITKEMKEVEASVAPLCGGAIVLGGLIVAGVYLVGRGSGFWYLKIGLVGVLLILFGAGTLIQKSWRSLTGR